MSANKYSNVLTIILIALLVIVLGSGGFLIYKLVNPKDKQKIEAMAELDKSSEEDNNEENEEDNSEIEIDDSANNSSNGNQVKKKTYYEGFVMLGYITIDATNVKEPILDTVTPETLNTAVAALYPSNAQLNQPGNVVIVGHNYRNGKFFSNNKKLSIGDKIKIKDTSGTELTYVIYEKFETTEQDTSFYNRDTQGKPEITLSTCTDDSSARIIILAKAE